MKKAFTLIELLVAVAVLVMMLTFASMIFTVSIDAYRVAGATAEIMQKLRAVTGQLNNDFKGIRKDAPLLILFHQEPNNPEQRYDQVMFFADGDFQSIQLYKDKYPDTDGDKFIAGNVARIYYGQANINEAERKRILAKCQHILTADGNLDPWPDANDFSGSFDDVYKNQKKNEFYEHDSVSLAQWKTVDRDTYKAANSVIDVCFGTRPQIDMDDPNTFHKLMCEGVSSLAIQWAYWDSADEKFYWFPSDDPDGKGTYSHFVLNGGDEFGIYFEVPVSTPKITGWEAIEDENVQYKGSDKFPPEFFPKAFKFTFKLHDSKGIIEKGMVFTHIVYIGD